MKKPLPDLPVIDNTVTVPVTLLNDITISSPVSRPYVKKIAYLLAWLLTFIGACSDGAQKLFGSGQSFGIDDLTQNIEQASSPLERFGIAYLLLGALAAILQSISLEKSFTQNFIFDLFRLSTAIESPGLSSLQQQPLFATSLHLAWYEYIPLNLIRISGAAVRGISSLMGYRTISNALSLSIIMPPSLIDAGQTLATEGVFLKNHYLLLRLKLKTKLFPERYTAEFLTSLQAFIDADDYPCQTKRGTALYLSCFALGTLAVLSDIGLAKFILDDFANTINVDTNALSFQIPQAIGLTSLFLLISAIDSKSLAAGVTRYTERSNLNETPATLNRPKTHPLLIGLASVITLIGASITALGAYEGNRYLLNQFGANNSRGVMAVSTLIAILKGCQSLAVEGCYTLKAAIESQWQPSCSALYRVIGAFSALFSKNSEHAAFVDAPTPPYTTLV